MLSQAGPAKTFAACVAGAFVPGLGHAFLGKWDRAVVFFGSISILFVLGLRLHGKLFDPEFGNLFSRRLMFWYSIEL